jgi:hypothetical protein
MLRISFIFRRKVIYISDKDILDLRGKVILVTRGNNSLDKETIK